MIRRSCIVARNPSTIASSRSLLWQIACLRKLPWQHLKATKYRGSAASCHTGISILLYIKPPLRMVRMVPMSMKTVRQGGKDSKRAKNCAAMYGSTQERSSVEHVKWSLQTKRMQIVIKEVCLWKRCGRCPRSVPKPEWKDHGAECRMKICSGCSTRVPKLEMLKHAEICLFRH